MAADWTKIGVTGISTLVGDYNGDGHSDILNFTSTTSTAQVHLTEVSTTTDILTATDLVSVASDG
ncbi:hypothetical protein, partial [Bradyrhizobium sp. CCBAU 45394]|uniref:hypothetical protein n=1 Tax=Bradyrhizobium sp. CCBAU 45394 TaxID=1325087 RepID=UPI002302F16D